MQKDYNYYIIKFGQHVNNMQVGVMKTFHIYCFVISSIVSL